MPCDYKNYPLNWKSEIRPAILERCGNKCFFCGVENGRLIHRHGNDWTYWPEGMESEAWSLDGLKSTKIVLTIMHLDHNTKNNDYNNLAAGCQKCHLNYDKNYHKKNSIAVLIHQKPPLVWKIFMGRRKLMPVVWKYVIPDLKYFKKHFSTKGK